MTGYTNDRNFAPEAAKTIIVHEVTPEDAYQVSLQIPEFEPWYPWSKWNERLSGRKYISLVAMMDGSPAGFKVGYFESDHFYSWVGGVLPEYRRKGVAHQLASIQEDLVARSGCREIRMKTHNRFREMLIFALRREFLITDVEQRGELRDWKITLRKILPEYGPDEQDI